MGEWLSPMVSLHAMRSMAGRWNERVVCAQNIDVWVVAQKNPAWFAPCRVYFEIRLIWIGRE